MWISRGEDLHISLYVARKCGLHAAVMLAYIDQLTPGTDEARMLHQGEPFQLFPDKIIEKFPFLTKEEVNLAILNLEEGGFIQGGEFHINKNIVIQGYITI